MARIKFLLRLGEKEDGEYEWDTRVEEVPESILKGGDSHEAARQWGRKNLPNRSGYENVTYIGIQSMDPREPKGEPPQSRK